MIAYILYSSQSECQGEGNDFKCPPLCSGHKIMKYYFLKEICLFKDEQCLNIYKSILFNEGAKYASEKAKADAAFKKAVDYLGEAVTLSPNRTEIKQMQDQVKAMIK